MLKKLHIKVNGHVQGVFFRATTQEKALELDLKGWVKNTSDSGVEIEAEGEEEVLLKFLEWVKEGPDSAKVEGCDYEWGEASGGFEDFEIKY